jgi:hypothetical protein
MGSGVYQKGDGMTVAELIEYLKTQPQELHVVYQYQDGSESCLLHLSTIEIQELPHPWMDGWIPPYKEGRLTQQYLVLKVE